VTYFFLKERARADAPEVLYERHPADYLTAGPPHLLPNDTFQLFAKNEDGTCGLFLGSYGLDCTRPGQGQGRGRVADHLVPRKYIDKNGKEAVRMGLSFNPFLKTKMLGVLGSCFIKQDPEKCKYRRLYDEYKQRLEVHPAHADFHRVFGQGPLLLTYQKNNDGVYKRRGNALILPEGIVRDGDNYAMPDGSVYQMGKTPGHRHAMANRYAVKAFLQDLWVAWRTLEGLPVTEPYSEAKLGLISQQERVS